MGILDNLFGNNDSSGDDHVTDGAIPYGRQKNTGGHDHRSNRGDDRTPAQKAGDEARRNDDEDKD